MTKHLLVEVLIGSSLQINRGQLIGDIFTKSSLTQMHMGQFKQHSHLEWGGERLMQIARGTIQQMTLSPKKRGANANNTGTNQQVETITRKKGGEANANSTRNKSVGDTFTKSKPESRNRHSEVTELIPTQILLNICLIAYVFIDR